MAMTNSTDKAEEDAQAMHRPLRDAAEAVVDTWIRAHGLVVARWMVTQAQQYLHRICKDERLERKIGSYSDPCRSTPQGKSAMPRGGKYD
jgi:hypothetical protein